jgi:hypothetical protein
MSLLHCFLVAALLLAADGDPTEGGGQIRGQVTGTDGEALVGISLVLLPRGHPHVAYATSTDDRGRYGFNQLLTDRYQVRADGQGFLSLVKEPVAVQPPFRSIIDMEMEDGPGPQPQAGAETGQGTVGRLGGRFLDTQGEPVLEGSVIFRRMGHPEDIFYGRTDPDGRFELRDLPAGTYDIVSRSPGLIPLHLVGIDLPAVEAYHLRLVAPPYPLSFRGWLDDLLPVEVPLPPPTPREVEQEPEGP